MNRFQNKYRIESTRLKKWDYSRNASYFVTICTFMRKCYFGRIESGIMVLSELGCQAEKLWQEIPEHFPFVELSDFVVMPNHVHGIIIINNLTPQNETTVETQNFASLQQPNEISAETQNLASPQQTNEISAETQNLASPQQTNDISVETQNLASLQRPINPQPILRPSPPPPVTPKTGSSKNQFGPQSRNLASIVRGYKIGVTKISHEIIDGFQWQPRYHDHIIRNDRSFERIRNYIRNNPLKWMEDTLYEKFDDA